MSRVGRPTQTTPEAWVDAALEEIEAVGVGGLSVQSVARRLGVTKGGFYHYFADRRELLQAALSCWEERFVTALTRRFAAVTDPHQRLHDLLVHAGIELQPTVIVQLMAAADDPDVAAALQRAATGRLALLRRIFLDLGLDRATANNRALLAYSTYLGLAELRRHAPSALGAPARTRAFLAEVEAALLAGTPS